MLHYTFPIIKHLDDVRAAVKDRKEFTILDRGPLTVVSYQVVMPETFPDVKENEYTSGFMNKVRREARGLIFSSRTGQLLRRPYHKFFNLNERNETLAAKVDLSAPHVILEKLDGSMVTPVVVGDKLAWATKLGITGVAMDAAAHVEKHPEIEHFCDSWIGLGYTPIFEWMSRSNKIVVDHPVDRMVLTAIRRNIDGHYLSYRDMMGAGERTGVEVVGTVNVKDLRDVADMEDTEGVVVRFDDGHMIKVKSSWYVLRHKSKEAINQEKNVLDMIVNDQVDDVVGMLTEDEARRLRTFQGAVLTGMHDYAHFILGLMASIRGKSRKDFALLYDKDFDKMARAIVFKHFDDNPEDVNFYPDIYNTILDAIRKNLSSNPRVESVRHLWGGKRWSDYD